MLAYGQLIGSSRNWVFHVKRFNCFHLQLNIFAFCLQISKLSSKFSTTDAERYWTEVAGLKPEQLVFVDETGFNQKSFQRRYGRSKKNTKCLMRIFAANTRRTNVIAAVSLRGFLAVKMFQASCNKEIYNEYIINELVSVFG